MISQHLSICKYVWQTPLMAFRTSTLLYVLMMTQFCLFVHNRSIHIKELGHRNTEIADIVFIYFLLRLVKKQSDWHKEMRCPTVG